MDDSVDGLFDDAAMFGDFFLGTAFKSIKAIKHHHFGIPHSVFSGPSGIKHVAFEPGQIDAHVKRIIRHKNSSII